MARDDVLLREIAALRQLSIDQLRARYVQVFGEETRTRNREFIFKRIAYRLQEIKFGGLTKPAHERASVLAKDAPIRRRGTCTAVAAELAAAKTRDPRLPPPGTVLRRTFGGVEHTVTVLDQGFEYEGASFKSLSVIARKITGTRWNGFGFFGLLSEEAA